MFFFCRFKVQRCFFYSPHLFRTHRKRLGSVFNIFSMIFYRHNCRLNIINRTFKPFSFFVLTVFYSFKTFFLQNPVYIMVQKRTAITVHGRIHKFNFIWFRSSRPQSRIMFMHTLFNSSSCVPNL